MTLTPRQRIINALTQAHMSAKDLASSLSLPEREIEQHLLHVKKSLHRQSDQHFKMTIPFCWKCQYEFTTRTKLTRPSRCPRCKSEDTSSPRFSIESVPLKKGKKNQDIKQEGDRSSG